MKKTHKIISILLVLAMLLSVAPLTAFAATEAYSSLLGVSKVAYSNNVTQYFQEDNYLYKVTYSNMKNTAKVELWYDNYIQLLLSHTSSDDSSSGYVRLYKAENDLAYLSDLPKSPGTTLSCMTTFEEIYNKKNKPVVTITCLAVNAPAWTWDGTSSATAKFTSTDGNAFANVTATISQETVTEATTCQIKEQIKYTASVTFNGQTYTNTKTVTGAAGPHSYINGKCEHCGYECPHNSFSEGKCNVCGAHHTHDYIYTANGNVITATCSNSDGACLNTNGGTLTISAPAELYADGTISREATVENNLVDTSVAVGEITYSSADGSAPKTAGTYTASVTVGGATASVEFTLSNYAAKVTDEDGNLIGNYKTFADAVTAAQEIEYSTLTLLDDITVTTFQIINSGNFTIDLNGKTLLSESSFALRIQSGAHVIIKDSGEGGTVESKTAGAEAIINYGGLTVESGTIKGDGGIDNRGFLNFIGGTAEGVTYSAIDNCGSAGVHGGVMKSENGDGITNDSGGVLSVYGGEISGYSGIANYDTAFLSGGEFKGNSYAAINLISGTVEITGGSFTGTDDEYGSLSGTPYGESTVDYTEGANLTLKGGEFPNGFTVHNTTANTLLADGYYFRDADGKIITVAENSTGIDGYVKVTKGADFSADAVVNVDNAVYNGAAQEPTVTVTIGSKTLIEGKDYTLTFANNINAGMATVTVTGAGDYEGEIVKTFEIAKADSSVDVYPEANKLTYNGEAQALVTAGSSESGTVVYSLDGAEYSVSVPTGTNAGEYTVYYKVIGDANHNDTEPETLTVTIGKKSVTVSATVPNRIYGDDYQVDTSKVVVTFDGIVDGDNVGYVVIDAYYHVHTVTDNAPVQVVYNVNGADAGNYQFPEYGDWMAPNYGVQATGKVLPRDISDAQITLGDVLIYNGAEQTQSIASVTVIGKDVTYTVSGNTAKNVGVYQLTVTGTGNFTGEAKITFEIAVDMNGVDFDQLHPLNVKATDKEKIEYIYNQLDNAFRDYADAEKRNEWDNNKSYCVELFKMIESVANHIESFENDLAKYDINTVTSDDDADLESLEESIGYFYDYYFDNLTEEQEKKTSDIFWAVVKLEIRISDIAKEIKRLLAAANGYDEATVTSADKDALVKLNEDIYALALTENVTAEEKENLQAAHDKVFGLIDKLVGISDEIKRITEKVDAYVFESVKSTDKADIQQLIADIKALLDTQNLTADERTFLETSDETCDKLVAKIDETVAEIKRINNATNAYDEATVTSADKEAVEQLIADIKALTDGDNITDAEREQLVADDETLDELLAKINATADEIARIEEAVNGYDEATVKSTDKADLEQLKADIKALTDTNNIPEDERAKLGNLDATLDSLIKKIDDTAAEIARINEAVNSYDIETVTSADVPALGKLIDDIKALTDGDNLTDDEKAALEANDESIDELVAKLTEVAEEIKRVDEAVKSYDEETIKSTDKADLEQLKSDIQALIDSKNTTENEKIALGEMIKDIEGLEDKVEETAKEIERIENAVNGYDEETVKSTDKADLEQLKSDIQKLIDSGNVTEEEIAGLEETKADADTLTDTITETEEKLEEIKEIENNFNPENVSSDDKADIEEKIAEIENVNPDNLTEEQKAEYDEIKAGFEALLEKIEKAGSEVDTIGSELEMFDEERVTIFHEDEIEVLKAKIDELLADENMGEAEKAKLGEYKAQCDNLIEIINTPAKYFSMRLFYFVWDALRWLSSGNVFIFN